MVSNYYSHHKKYRSKGTYDNGIKGCGIVVSVGVCGFNVNEGLANNLREVLDSGFVKCRGLNSRKAINEPVAHVNNTSMQYGS